MNKPPKILSVCSGGGGRGCSLVAAALGGVIALGGVTTVLLDAEPKGSGKTGLGRLFGLVHREAGARELAGGGLTGLDDALKPTSIDRLGILGAAGRFLAGDDPEPLKALLKTIGGLSSEYVLADIGSSATGNVFDFIAASNELIMVLEPDPAHMEKVFNFLKGFVYRRIEKLFRENPIMSGLVAEYTDSGSSSCVKSFADLCARISEVDRRSAERALAEVKSFRPMLVLNMISSGDDIRAAEVLKQAAETSLGLDTVYMGAIDRYDAVEEACFPALFGDERARELKNVAIAIAARLIPGWSWKEREVKKGLRDARADAAEKPLERLDIDELPEAFVEEVFGFNDNIIHEGTVFHVQTEVTGGDDPVAETVVYQGGRVFFSKRSRWSEIGDPSGLLVDIKNFASKQHKAAIAAVRNKEVLD